MNFHSIGYNMKEHREKFQRSKQEIAKELQMPVEIYELMEKGQFPISAKTLHSLSSYYDTTMEELCKPSVPSLTDMAKSSAVKLESFEKMEELLSVFGANERLYNQMKAKEKHLL